MSNECTGTIAWKRYIENFFIAVLTEDDSGKRNTVLEMAKANSVHISCYATPKKNAVGKENISAYPHINVTPIFFS